MLTELHLQNFRCFSNHRVPFRARTIVVGRNNAGKSTIVEALRLVSIVAERYHSLTYRPPPRWVELHRTILGVSPSLDGQDLNFDRVFHRYNPPPATVTARFDNGATISVYVGPDCEIFSVIRDSRAKPIRSKAEARALSLPSMAALSQIGPLRSSERVLEEDYVHKSASTSLDSIHFRNQLHFLGADNFDRFKRLSEETWHGLAINELTRNRDSNWELMVRNDDFAAEVGWMGHGLQMWLQTMWFLARHHAHETVILDEPDVYMHADLQRKLVRFLSNRHPQVIIATHSIEIMTEVEPEDILVVDKDRRQAKFAADLPEVQQIIGHIGGVHNIQLARMAHAQKCLMVEGHDVDLLRRWHTKLFPASEHPLDIVPNFSIGGWGGWDDVLGSTLWVERVMKEISIFCLLDSDYHVKSQMEERLDEAQRKSIRLWIWKRKEIENYLLEPIVIARMLTKISRGKRVFTSTEVKAFVEEKCEVRKQETFDNFASEIQCTNRGLSAKSTNQLARTFVEAEWKTFNGRIGLVSGKELLKEIADWSRQIAHCSFTNTKLAAEFKRSELHEDVVEFLTAFEYNEDLPEAKLRRP